MFIPAIRLLSIEESAIVPTLKIAINLAFVFIKES